jgi:putative holliday junction resolvase
MALFDLAEFTASIGASGALLGLDPGSKTIGVAAADPSRSIASGIAGIRRTRMQADADAVFGYYDGRACVGLVIGLPLNMDGSAGPSAQSARAFARNLLKVRDVACLMWDERLSTAAVTRAMIGNDVSRATRAAVVDQEAAAYMLQGLLDRLRRPLPGT